MGEDMKAALKAVWDLPVVERLEALGDLADRVGLMIDAAVSELDAQEALELLED